MKIFKFFEQMCIRDRAQNCGHPHATLSAMPTPRNRPSTSPSAVNITYFYRSHSHTRPKTQQGISHHDM